MEKLFFKKNVSENRSSVSLYKENKDCSCHVEANICPSTSNYPCT